MNTRSHMTLARLSELLDAYGADPNRWPAEEREDACALVAESPEARRRRDAAAELDDVLNLAPEAQPPAALIEQILAAAHQRESATVTSEMKSRLAAIPIARVTSASATRRTPQRSPAWRLIAGALPLAAAAALLIWTTRGSAPSPKSSGVATAEIGVYDAPTDVLLNAPGMGTLGGVPSFGCEGSGLGCLDLEPVQEQSTLNSGAYV